MSEPDQLIKVWRQHMEDDDVIIAYVYQHRFNTYVFATSVLNEGGASTTESLWTERHLAEERIKIVRHDYGKIDTWPEVAWDDLTDDEQREIEYSIYPELCEAG